MGKDLPNTNKKNSGIVILMSNKVDFRKWIFPALKKEYFIIIKDSIQMI